MQEDSETLEYEFNPPQFDVSREPTSISTAKPASQSTYNFARLAKWCSDGSALLAQCEDRSFQLFDLSLEKSSLNYIHRFNQPSAIVDFAWYPGASRTNLPSYCFVASVRECPVKLLDASDGRLRASYRIVDHRERQIAPHSLAFNLFADKLYCGFEDAIEVFDIQRPGEGIRLPTTPSKKSKQGLKGIISSLAFSTEHDFYAAGSLSPSSSLHPNLAIYSESNNDAIMFLGADVKSAVMQIRFHPLKPHLLYASFRRDNNIFAWDIRGSTAIPVQIFEDRTAKQKRTNQKLHFDIDTAGHWLSVGNQDGYVSLFDLESSNDILNSNEHSLPVLSFEAHTDTVSSVAFHPLNPVLLSTSGSRHFNAYDHHTDSDSSDQSDSSGSEDVADAKPHVKRSKLPPQPHITDGSLKAWSLRAPEAASCNDQL